MQSLHGIYIEALVSSWTGQHPAPGWVRTIRTQLSLVKNAITHSHLATVATCIITAASMKQHVSEAYKGRAATDASHTSQC